MMKSRRLKKYKLKTIMTATTIIAILLMATTYAWFSANREVTITDITARVVASEGMQVSLDGEIWGATLEINRDALADIITNMSSWPNELVPVSTDGTSTGGRLNLRYGEINAEGNTLQNVATEVDEDTTKYVSFDLFLKNASSDLAGNILKLSAGSFVRINEDGQQNTGLENSIRIGFVIYEETAELTAPEAEVQNLAAGNSPKVVIWEPNYNRHIAEVVINDRRIDAPDSVFTSWGLKTSAIGTVFQTDTADGNYYMDDAGNGIVAGMVHPNLDEPSTVQTDGLVADFVDLTAVDNSDVIVASNTISKVRVYIWLEGQDPDCNNTASTGKIIDIVINLAK